MKSTRIACVALFGAAMLLGFSSCTKDADMERESDGKMTFSSDLQSTKSTDVDLQSVQIASGVQAGVFVLAGEEVCYENVALTADGNGAFASSSDIYWPEASASVYAYAPYDNEWSDAVASVKEFTVAPDQSTDEGYLASDLLIGAPLENPVAQTAEEVSLVFAHKLSKVNVKVRNNNPGISLEGASLSVLNVLPTISVNVLTGELGAVSGQASQVLMATFASNDTESYASALVVPQTVAAGDFLQITTSDARTLVAKLGADIELKSNKRYTYTLRISGTGAGDASVELVLGSSISDWEDDEEVGGDASEVISYEVGDYVLADGTFMKASELETASDEVKADVAGVIFSTDVSAADAAAGYSGYALSTWGKKGSQTWSSQTVEAPLAAAVETQAAACADLDGLTFASVVAEADPEYSYYTAFDFTNYSSQRIALTGTNLSGWFVPSLGQLVQILENLGGVEVDHERTDFDNGQGENFGGEDQVDALLAKLNGHLVNAADSDKFGAGNFFASATEISATHMWGVTFSASKDGITYAYKISSKASKGNGGRNIAPVFAYKLPTE